MPQGGNLIIRASNLMIDKPLSSMSIDAKTGPYVILTVTDTGTGMPSDVLERIFDPFFTTKPLDRATGLGLSTVQGIVKSHGGFISVYSEVGKGSEFRIHLPARPAEAPGPEKDTAETLPSGKGETILIVDDEEAVRVLSKKTLEAFGYQVLTAGDGVQAVATCARQMGKIDLMITDLAMPIMDGVATIRAIRTLDPRIKIIASSGLDADGKSTQSEPAGANAFIQKPFTAASVLKLIREVLEPEPRSPISPP